MSNCTYFSVECPTCGRRLQIRVEYLGKRVMCQHCQGQFLASDPSNMRVDGAHRTDTLLRRADELLESAEQQTQEERSHFPR